MSPLSPSFGATSIQAPSFQAAFSAADNWPQAAKVCCDQLDLDADQGEGEALGFVYGTDIFSADMSSILTFLQETTGIDHWVGTTGIGICALGVDCKGDGVSDAPALAVMVGHFPSGTFRVFSTITGETDGFHDETRNWLDTAGDSIGLLHGDPRNPFTAEILRRIGRETSAYLVGGLTASRGAYSQIADTVTQGGISGVLFSNQIRIITGLTQGCAPIGPVHTITSSFDDHIVAEIDGSPAFDVFAEDVGGEMEGSPDGSPVSVMVGLPVRGSDTGDYLVRNLAGVDPESGLIMFTDQVRDGDSVLFCRRSTAFAERDLRRMLESLRERAGGTPKGGVYFTCAGRGASLFGADGVEAAIIRQVLGDFPLVGFSANGEISHDRLYSYTGVLTLFL